MASKTKKLKTDERSLFEIVLEIARHEFEVLRTKEGEFVAFPRTGPKVQIDIFGSSGSLVSEIQMKCFRITGKYPSRKLIDDVIGILMGECKKNQKYRLYKRHASIGDSHYIDIGDETGEVIEIRDGNFTIIKHSPCLFRRNDLMDPLPKPKVGRDLNEVFKVLGIPQHYWALITGWLIANLNSDSPGLILLLDGEQGTGKTTVSKILGALMDPPNTPQSPPDNRESWFDMCGRSRVIILDNLSEISKKFSDDLCRASTGAVENRRKKYTDGNTYSIGIRQIIILNGIGLAITRNDLVDRIIQIKMPKIPETNVITEKDLWAFWEDIYPEALGSLLSKAARVYQHLPNVKLESSPRMADFAKVLKSLDEIEGTNAYQVYCEGLSSMSALTVENDPFLIAITKEIKKPWEGTAAQLQMLLSNHSLYGEGKNWPASPRDISAKLSRSAPALRRLGFEIEDLGNRNMVNTKRWRISPDTSVTSITSDIFLFNKKEKKEGESVEGYGVS